MGNCQWRSMLELMLYIQLKLIPKLSGTTKSFPWHKNVAVMTCFLLFFEVTMHVDVTELNK